MDEPDDEPTTEELRVVASDRERAARRAADESLTEGEAAKHDRRAEKSAYLREKLAEREQAERDAEKDERD